MHIFMVIAITMAKYMQYMSEKRLVQLVKKITQIFNIQPLHFAGKSIFWDSLVHSYCSSSYIENVHFFPR